MAPHADGTALQKSLDVSRGANLDRAHDFRIFLDKDGQWRTGEKSGHDNYSDFRLIRDRQYAAIRKDGGVHIVEWSENGFERLGSGLETMRVLSLAVSPDGTIMAGTENGLWISADKGISWNEVELQLRRDSMTTETNTKMGVEF